MQKFLKYFLIVITLWILTLPWTANYLTKITDAYPAFVQRHDSHSSSWSMDRVDWLPHADKTELKSIKFVRLGVVSCGQDRMDETLTLTKSAIISALRFKLESLEFIVFADDESLFPFDIKLNELKEQIPGSLNFRYEIHPLIFPPKEDTKEWMNLFRPCATQRLFLPSALPHIGELIYLDTDVLVLEDLREIWSYFSKMNSSQHTALAPEHESHSIGWYNRFARHPYYLPLGVNSGVMLMNLTKLRGFHWEQKAIKYYKEYKQELVFGDQDIINIIFHYYPESLYILPCAFNYRPDHCIYGRGCPSVETKNSSIRLIHGNRRVFHEPSKVTGFQVIYSFFDKFTLSTKTKFVIKDNFRSLKTDLRVLNSGGRGGCDEIGQLVYKTS